MDDEEDMGENVAIVSIPTIEKGEVVISRTTLKCDKEDENLFSEKYKVLLYSMNERGRMNLTDEFDANFIDGKPFSYVMNLARCGIFSAVLNRNIKNFEENLRIAKKIFEVF